MARRKLRKPRLANLPPSGVDGRQARGGAKERRRHQDKVPRPHEMGERWLGEAETERGSALRRPLSVRFADTSPRLWRGEEPKLHQVGGTAPPSALPGISPTRGEIGSFRAAL
ncbi:hypothetical protein MPLA_230051 [Mesorhizobium sp. ORS 3359]|nr:hypothetical protein MPLA_230051 [Mesorhizobium sp. ORS 3359]